MLDVLKDVQLVVSNNIEHSGGIMVHMGLSYRYVCSRPETGTRTDQPVPALELIPLR